RGRDHHRPRLHDHAKHAAGRWQHDPGHDRVPVQRVERPGAVGPDGGRPHPVCTDAGREHAGLAGGGAVATGQGGGDRSATVEPAAREDVVWAAPPKPPGERKIRPGRIRPADAGVLAGAAAAALALTWLLYGQLAPTSGQLGFVICWFASFVLIYWICQREL